MRGQDPAPPTADTGAPQAPGAPARERPPAAPKRAVVAGAVFITAVPVVQGILGELGMEPGLLPRLLVAGVMLAGFLVWVVEYLRNNTAVRSRRAAAGYYGAVAGLIACLVTVFLVFQDSPPHETTVLPGTRDIAVVGFEPGAGMDRATVTELSDGVADALKVAFSNSEVHDYAGEESPPLADLAGTDLDEANRWAEKFVGRSKAEMVIGGIVTASASGQTTVDTAVYVRPEQVAEAPELAGWYRAEPILTDLPLGSTRGRDVVVTEVVRRARGLESFTDALDAAAAGRPAEADDILRTLLPPTDPTDPAPADRSLGFLPPEFVHLFRGHALQQLARRGTPEEQPGQYAAARAEYAAISASSRLHHRAKLSLAINDYLRSVGRTCWPGTVGADDLANAAETTRVLAADPTVPKIGRLKASLVYAQAQECRSTAGLAPDDGSVDAALTRVRAATETSEAGSVAGDLGALAISVAAQRAATKGDLAAAVETIRAAIDRTPRFAQRALWYALLTTWHLRACDFAAAAAAQQDSLRELGVAAQHGEVEKGRQKAYEKEFAAELARAQARCS